MNAIAHASASPLRGPKLDNRRVLAAVVDLAIVALGAAVVLFAADALALDEMKGALGAVVLGWALYYFFALESGDGQTVGKKLMKLRVVREDGSPAGMREIAVRTILRVIDNYLVGLIVMLATGERRQRIGDLAAGTVVVDASGPAPAAVAATAEVAVADEVAVAGEAAVADEAAEDEAEEDEVEGDEVGGQDVPDDAPAATATITLPSRPAPPATLSDLAETVATEQAEAAQGAEERAEASAKERAEDGALPEITSPSIEELARDVEAAHREPVEEEPVAIEPEPTVVEPEPVVEVESFERETVEPEPVVEVESFEPEPAVETEPAVEVEPVQTGSEEVPEVEVVAAEPVPVEPVPVEPVESEDAGDEEVNVRSVETVSAIDLIMGGAAEPQGADESDEDDRPASA